MEAKRGRPEHLFVVRLWREPQSADDGSWRGSVHDVASGQRLHFTELNDMKDFVELRLGDGHESRMPPR